MHGSMSPAQTFGQIQRELGDVFSSGAFDGILGLSFPSWSQHFNPALGGKT